MSATHSQSDPRLDRLLTIDQAPAPFFNPLMATASTDWHPLQARCGSNSDSAGKLKHCNHAVRSTARWNPKFQKSPRSTGSPLEKFQKSPRSTGSPLEKFQK